MQMSELFKGSYCTKAKPDTPFPRPLSLSLSLSLSLHSRTPQSKEGEVPKTYNRWGLVASSWAAPMLRLRKSEDAFLWEGKNVIEKQKRKWTQSYIMWL